MTRAERAIERVQHYAAELRTAEGAARRAAAARDRWIVKAAEAGVPSNRIARAARLSPGRITQLAPRPARDDAPTDSRAVPTISATAPLLSGLVSTRSVRPYGRPTTFVSSGPVAAILASLAPPGKDGHRVFVTGPRPGDGSAADTRAWALGALPAGWAVDRRGHYLADLAHPVLRFRHELGGLAVVMRSAAWFGETDATISEQAAAWSGLESVISDAFHSAGLADTPAGTGRALWLRTVREGGYPVLSDELRELIAATSGQGRIELLTGHGEIPAFTVYDGRLMYAALTWGMPVGEPVRWTGAELADLSEPETRQLLRGRCRVCAYVAVPKGWDHVGLLPQMEAEGAGWVYPSKPGRSWTGWFDGAEALLALDRGWHVQLHEAISWDEGKPLNTWTKLLTGLYADVGDSTVPRSLGQRAIRAILLHGIGAFASRHQDTTGAVPINSPELVPEDAIGGSVAPAGDHLVYAQRGAPSRWAAECAHPEWAAAIWGRARARLLVGRAGDGHGALYLPKPAIVAFATDALYLTHDPRWPDDGSIGSFRWKGGISAPRAWPISRAELMALRDEASR